MNLIRSNFNAAPICVSSQGVAGGCFVFHGWWLALISIVIGLGGFSSSADGFLDQLVAGRDTNNIANITSASPVKGDTLNTSNLDSSSEATLETNRVNTLDDKYQLAIGDRLSFRIIEDEDDPKAILVTDSGEVEVPYVGRFSAAGKTCKQLAGQIKIELEKKYYYRATVIISVDTVTSRGIVYIIGPVNKPGPLEIPRDETLTLSKAIMRAGGFTDLADQNKVRVTRVGQTGKKGQAIFTVNVYKILTKGESDGDIVLKPGDLIFIPEKLIRF